jgi:poly(hydroxyalkanoate) granule-associated protein
MEITMIKKAKKTAAADLGLPPNIKESAQQIWSAGKGAISRAQQEGNRVFEALVRESGSLRDTLQKSRSATSVSEVAARATDTWDKLEHVFENRVARALGSLGVPTRKDLESLTARVDALTKLVEKLVGPAAKKATTAKAPVKKVTKPATKVHPKAAA